MSDSLLRPPGTLDLSAAVAYTQTMELWPAPIERGCLLPDGCKDLIDVLHTKGSVRDDGFLVNQAIQAPTVRVIDQDGKLLGLMDLSAALELARAGGFDLVQLSLPADPPVCRIVDWTNLSTKSPKKPS